MDLRTEKTEKAIRNAFMELRAQKPLEKITVKELCALACINKSTFYAHYSDIYALSETLEQETVLSIVICTEPALFVYYHSYLFPVHRRFDLYVSEHLTQTSLQFF